MDLSQLIDIYRGPLLGLIASWGAPWVDATEIAQDSFAEAYLNRESCRGDWEDPEVFGRWLRGVARNQYRNWARRTARNKGDRIHARRRVNHLAFSCGGEACRRDIKVIRVASQKSPDHVFKMIAPASALVTKEGVS